MVKLYLLAVGDGVPRCETFPAIASENDIFIGIIDLSLQRDSHMRNRFSPRLSLFFSGIERVFDKLFEHVCRTFDDFARGDLVDGFFG
jgi:hypothetical protein